MNFKVPISLKEFKNQRTKVRNVNEDFRNYGIGSLDRFALKITALVGSILFFFVIFLVTTVWLFWNVFAPETHQFDPAPAFVIWLFISNFIQLMLIVAFFIDKCP